MSIINFRQFKQNSIVILSLILTIWFLITVNKNLGELYIPVFVAAIALFFNLQLFGGMKFGLEADSFRLEDLLTGGAMWLAYIGISSLLYGVLQGTAGLTSLNSVLSIQEATTPIFQGNLFFTWAGWGVIIPFAETLVLLGAYITLLHFPLFNGIRSRKFDFTHIALILTIAFGFVFFHLQVSSAIDPSSPHGFTLDNLAMFQHFIFAIITLAVTAWRMPQEMAPAFYMHSISNSMVVFFRFGYLKSFGLGV